MMAKGRQENAARCSPKPTAGILHLRRRADLIWLDQYRLAASYIDVGSEISAPRPLLGRKADLLRKGLIRRSWTLAV